MASSGRVILVTGGTGLVGKGIEHVVGLDEEYKKDKFIFLSSKDGDLRYVPQVSSLYRRNSEFELRVSTLPFSLSPDSFCLLINFCSNHRI